MEKKKKNKTVKTLVCIILILLLVGATTCSKSEDNNSEPDKVVDNTVESEKENENDSLVDEKEGTESTESSEITDDKELTDNNEEATDSTVKEESKKSSSDSNKNESSTSKEPSTPAHTHNWVEVKTAVQHGEEGHYEDVCVKEAWTEEIPVYETVAIEVCGNYGEDVTENAGQHIKEHKMNGTGQYGCRTEYVEKQTGTETITHEAVYEKQWIVDKKAWTETILTYKCSCGATK